MIYSSSSTLPILIRYIAIKEGASAASIKGTPITNHVFMGNPNQPTFSIQ